MMVGGYLITFFLLAYLSGVLLVSPTGSIVQVPSNDLYSESPCELHSLSAFKDTQGNVWGIGDGNLWWFNATNLSWSLLPLPNGSSPSEPWRVACVDPRKYVAIVGRNSSLVLHLPWQHWQSGDTDDVKEGRVDATWCVGGALYATDPPRETLYALDVEEARWGVEHDLLTDFSNHSADHGVASAWVGYNGELVLVVNNGHHDHVAYANASGLGWVVVAENNLTGLWPDLEEEGRSLTWSLDPDRLWMWKEEKNEGVAELWMFDMNSTTWTKGRSKLLPPLENVLTGWTDGDRYCVLKRSIECTSQYSISGTVCWKEVDMMMMMMATAEDEVVPPQTSTTSTTTTTDVPSTTPTSLPPPPPRRPRPSVASSRRDEGWSSEDEAVAIAPSRGGSNWHQHTSVFGSVIFFGTSITIFAIFGMFWCMRKCVHFPKEALLLRDPPSVRYTAIPDSLGYDSRRATPATYTVIPDSMA